MAVWTFTLSAVYASSSGSLVRSVFKQSGTVTRLDGSAVPPITQGGSVVPRVTTDGNGSVQFTIDRAAWGTSAPEVLVNFGPRAVQVKADEYGDYLASIATGSSAASIDAHLGGDATNLVQTLPTQISEQAIAPDDAGYDLVLLLGQSNMSGRGTPYDTTRFDPVSPRIEQYGATGTYAGVASVAVEPLAMHDTPSGIGPGLAFARWYVQSIPSARRVMLVPSAHGGTMLSTSATPLGWRRGVAGNLYAQALTQAQNALTAAGANSQIVAALWVQGESDGDSSITGSQYQTDLDALITGLRTDLGIPDLPFIIGEMVPDYLTTGTRAAINTVQAATPSRIARTAFSQGVPGQNLNDGNHYNAAAQRIIGRRMYDAYRRVINGTPDPALPAAPGQVTGVTATAAATTAAVSWSAITGATYIVEYRTTGAGTWTRAGSTTGTTYTITGLTQSTGYDTRVTAVNAGGPGTASATATFTTGTIPAVTDSFNRADSTTTLGNTDTGQAWVTDAGSVWGITSNQATMVSGSNGRAQVECGRADGTFSVKFATVGGGANHSRLFFRGDGSVNYWFVQGRVSGGVAGKLQLYKSVAGSLSQVSVDSAANWAAGDTVSVVCSGSTITVKQNGATVIGPVTDSFMSTATMHGLGAVGNGPLFDDFSSTA